MHERRGGGNHFREISKFIFPCTRLFLDRKNPCAKRIRIYFSTLKNGFFIYSQIIPACSSTYTTKKKILHDFSFNYFLFLTIHKFEFEFPGGESVLLSSGIHSFPFKLGLPLGLPSTFLGKHGWVINIIIIYLNFVWENDIIWLFFSFSQVQYFCKAALREEAGLTHKNQQVRLGILIPRKHACFPVLHGQKYIIRFFFFQVFIIMNPIDLNLEPPILAVRILRIIQRFFSNFESRKNIRETNFEFSEGHARSVAGINGHLFPDKNAWKVH